MIEITKNVPLVINLMNEQFVLLTIIVIGKEIISLLYVETSLDKLTLKLPFLSNVEIFFIIPCYKY